MSKVRTAIVKSDMGSEPSVEKIAAYLPANYTATKVGKHVIIMGKDDHGWTLDGYVIPRLGSGLIVATEFVPG